VKWASPVAIIAISAGIGSFSTQFWIPFLTFYLLRIGATSPANAVFWLALALAGQGIGRILTGPIWGYLADRYGRKPMYVRALYAASLTMLIAGFARAPWYLVAAFSLQGALSGFIPAAVALTSVTVPRHRLSTSLATVTACQYLGTTVGPALGAIFAAFFGFRGAILAGAALPSIMAAIVTLTVARDEVAPRAAAVAGTPERGRLSQFTRQLSAQFGLALMLYFVLYAGEQVLRTASPIAISVITHVAAPTVDVGVAFTAAGVGSVAGAFGLSRIVIRPHRMRLSLVIVITLQALAHILLATSASAHLYSLWLGVIFFAQGAMIPSTNTLIASSVTPAWRGTAFGVASSFQAAAFILGPLSAAGFATFSIFSGFLAVGGVFLLTGIVLLVFLKEPEIGGPLSSRV
jgi:DHA1 family multidrug resistance protein-like MFS transporter